MKRLLKIFIAVLILSMAAVSPVSVSAAKKGIRTENGKQYYYKKGKKVKNKAGIKISGKYYRISKKGVLTPVSKADGLAGIYAEKYNKNLSKAFTAISKMKYRAVSKKSDEKLACYGFEKKAGDCNVQALCFYYVAKALGNNASFVKGYVPTALNKDGSVKSFGAHAWVTIKKGNTTYVYDPALAQHYYLNRQKNKMKLAFKFKYGKKGTYQYYDSNKVLIR